MTEQLKIFENNLPANINDLAKFIKVGRELLWAQRAFIKTLPEGSTDRKQALETAILGAEYLLDAEVKLGGIMQSMDTKQGKRNDLELSSNSATKLEQLRSLGFDKYDAYRFEMLASFPEIIELIKTEAKQKETLPTRSEALKKITHFIKKKTVTEAEGKYQESIKGVEDFTEDIFNTDQKFNIIYADPPWQYWEGGFKNQSLHYPTMSMDDIKKLPVQNIADDNCILFIWVTFPILKECFEVIQSWGFNYSTCGFVWLKKNKNIDSWFFGNGSWTRANVELCLIATKGTVTRMNAAISQIVEAPVSEHSEKPAIIRQLITDLVGALPRIELFSRSNEDNGWFNWGNRI
jgi:N6-adenosine-specific RNA methylase IME4